MPNLKYKSIIQRKYILKVNNYIFEDPYHISMKNKIIKFNYN